jgi:hypothetical protein
MYKIYIINIIHAAFFSFCLMICSLLIFVHVYVHVRGIQSVRNKRLNSNNKAFVRVWKTKYFLRFFDELEPWQWIIFSIIDTSISKRKRIQLQHAFADEQNKIIGCNGSPRKGPSAMIEKAETKSIERHLWWTWNSRYSIICNCSWMLRKFFRLWNFVKPIKRSS